MSIFSLFFLVATRWASFVRFFEVGACHARGAPRQSLHVDIICQHLTLTWIQGSPCVLPPACLSQCAVESSRPQKRGIDTSGAVGWRHYIRNRSCAHGIRAEPMPFHSRNSWFSVAPFHLHRVGPSPVPTCTRPTESISSIKNKWAWSGNGLFAVLETSPLTR